MSEIPEEVREALARAWCVSQSGSADDPGPCYVRIDFTTREVAGFVFEWLEMMAGLALPKEESA